MEKKQSVRPKTTVKQSLQIGDRRTPYASKARYVTTRPETAYKDRVDKIRSVRFDSNIAQDMSMLSDDGNTDGNDIQMDSSGQDKDDIYDHLKPIVSMPRGPAFWKLNKSLLSDPEYVSMVKDTVKTTCELDSEANAQLLWDVIKTQIRGNGIHRAKN